jgi:hypothetical protein
MKTESAIPSSLFKYQSFSRYALENLAARRLWFSKPTAFNDPFDCRIRIDDPSSVTREELIELYEIARERNPEAPVDPTAELLENVREGLGKGFDERIQTMLNRRGVCCFSERNDDILMWGHYAKGHTGFCLEFDGRCDPFKKAHPVEYAQEIPRVNPAHLLLRPSAENQIIKTMITTKAECWSYEKEWRLFHMEPDNLYSYPREGLVAVYLGLQVSKQLQDVMRESLEDDKVQLYRMERVPGQFGIAPRPL